MLSKFQEGVNCHWYDIQKVGYFLPCETHKFLSVDTLGITNAKTDSEHGKINRK